MNKVFLCAVVLALPLSAAAAPESYTFDPYHTYPYFEIEHFDISTVRGMFRKSTGKFVIDRATKAASVEISIETASIDTGDNDKGSRPRARDEHLRNADFFNVTEFPRMTFKSTAVKLNGENPTEVSGNLTLLGVTRPVTLKVDRWVCRDHPMSKKPMCGGNASGTLKRSEFGMKYGIPAIPDALKLFFAIEAYKD